MLEANEEYFRANGEPLFSSHMLDLSEEFDEENIATCVKYFKRMAAVKLWLEMEIGITGGEEDGVDNTGVKRWELVNYFRMAQINFYTVILLEPRTPWRFNVNQLAAKNTHGVPR